MEPGLKGDRVDKKWVERGIDSYSTEAILGTLAHYGVSIDEAGFLEKTKSVFPLELADEWHAMWKGTGQFTQFPGAAAEELWARFRKGEVAPTDFTLALINLLQMLDGVLGKVPDDGTRETRFKVVEAYLPKIPLVDAPDDRRARFLAETLHALGDWAQVWDGMAETLASQGHPEQAHRLVAVDESLFPDNLGISRALVKLQLKDNSGLDDLRAIGNDVKRTAIARLSAADGLLSQKQGDDAKAILLALLDIAEKDRDADLAGAVVEQMRRLLELDASRGDRVELRDRIAQLIATFEGKTGKE